MAAADARGDVVLLPHAYPFVFVDRVLVLTPGAWAVVVKNVTCNEPLVAPGGTAAALFLEVMAQAAGLAAASLHRRPTQILLAAITRFRCRSLVVVGEPLLVTARVLGKLGANVKVRVGVNVAGRICAAGDLVLHCG